MMSHFKSIQWPDPGNPKPTEGGNKRKPVYQQIAENEIEVIVPENAKRLVKSEQLAVFQILSMIDVTHNIMDGLERRLATIPRGLARMKTIRSLVSQLSLDILNTTPLDQRAHLVNQMKGLVTLTAVRNQLPINEDRKFGLFFSNNQIAVIEDALREQCMLCTIEDPGKQAKCPYAKLLDSMPLDKLDEDVQGCGWFHNWG